MPLLSCIAELAELVATPSNDGGHTTRVTVY